MPLATAFVSFWPQNQIIHGPIWYWLVSIFQRGTTLHPTDVISSKKAEDSKKVCSDGLTLCYFELTKKKIVSNSQP